MENMTGKTIFESAALCVQNINAVYPGGWNLDRYVSKFTQIHFDILDKYITFLVDVI